MKEYFEWSEDEFNAKISLISVAFPIGQMVGSIFVSSLIVRGRRRGMIISDVLGVIGAILSILGHEATFTLGRGLIGFSNGLSLSTHVVYNREMVPSHYAP